ncbi:MAG: sigma-70 family RNA polymerase sigma factor [Clostridia bacterium]|nr:sigma-70 family RNA polymerase sigma factor [Clostridia bacterium]
MPDKQSEQLNKLLAGVAKGETDYLDGVYLFAGKKMFAVAISLVGRDCAEDVVHDSLIKIARFAHKYKQDENPFGWVLKIVRNTALDMIRKKKAHPAASTEEFFSLASSDYSPDRRDDAIMIEQAIKRLAPDERQAIYFKYFIDLTVRDVAAEMNISKSAADRLIRKAEDNLKILLSAGRKED